MKLDVAAVATIYCGVLVSRFGLVWSAENLRKRYPELASENLRKRYPELASASVAAPIPSPVIPIAANPSSPSVAWIGSTVVTPWKVDPVIPWPVGSGPTTHAEIASASLDSPRPAPVIPIPANPASPSVAWIGSTVVTPWKVDPVIPWPVGSGPTIHAEIASASLDSPRPAPVIPIHANPASPSVAWIGSTVVTPWKVDPVIPWPVGSGPTIHAEIASASLDSPVPAPVIPVRANPNYPSAVWIGSTVVTPWKVDPVIPWPVGSGPTIHAEIASASLDSPVPAPLVPIPANPASPSVAWIGPTVVTPWKVDPVIPWPVGSGPTIQAKIASASLDSPAQAPRVPIPANPASPSAAWIGPTVVIPWEVEEVIPWPVGSRPTAVASATVDSPIPAPLVPIPANPASPSAAWIGPTVVIPWEIDPVIPWPVGQNPTNPEMGVASATVDNTEPKVTATGPTDSIPNVPISPTVPISTPRVSPIGSGVTNVDALWPEPPTHKGGTTRGGIAQEDPTTTSRAGPSETSGGYIGTAFSTGLLAVLVFMTTV